MRLQAYKPDDDRYYTVETGPTPESIRTYLEGLLWDDITFVRLYKNEKNWVECSGSFPDGFSIIYQENDGSFITRDEPEGLDHLVLTMQDYSIDGNEWKKICDWDPYAESNSEKQSGCLTALILLFSISTYFAMKGKLT